MNNVEFISIEGCNVKCIGYEPVKIVFDQYRGFTYVLGDNQDFPGLKNGVGKTAILGDLLLLGLYGRFSDKANNRDVFNRTSDPRDKGYVIVELEVNNKDR